MRQIIFDTETTGMNFNGRDKSEGHRIIEIGCVELIDRRPTERYFHRFLNPEQAIDPDAIRVHGITNERVAKEPTIAHNMPFDQSFFNREFDLAGVGYKLEDRFRLLDTLELARKKISGISRFSLDSLCKYYGIDNSNRTLHGALLDSQLLAEVYLKLTTEQSGFDFAAPAPVPPPQKVEIVEEPVIAAPVAASSPADWQVLEVPADEAAAHQAIMAKLRK